LGFGTAQAAEAPFGVDEDVDEAALFGCFGRETLDVFGDESCQVGRIFAADDFGFGIDAVWLETALPASVRGPVDSWELEILVWC
jgi:hypothetical protein